MIVVLNVLHAGRRINTLRSVVQVERRNEGNGRGSRRRRRVVPVTKGRLLGEVRDGVGTFCTSFQHVISDCGGERNHRYAGGPQISNQSGRNCRPLAGKVIVAKNTVRRENHACAYFVSMNDATNADRYDSRGSASANFRTRNELRGKDRRSQRLVGVRAGGGRSGRRVTDGRRQRCFDQSGQGTPSTASGSYPCRRTGSGARRGARARYVLCSYQDDGCHDSELSRLVNLRCARHACRPRRHGRVDGQFPTFTRPVGGSVRHPPLQFSNEVISFMRGNGDPFGRFNKRARGNACPRPRGNSKPSCYGDSDRPHGVPRARY